MLKNKLNVSTLVKQASSSLRSSAPEILIFLFAFLTRFVRLDFPPNHYFDEVYHVFTAQQMFKGNPAAWEWWNPNPAGFAFEWTHPPLAKEFMVFAISIFGDNPFAWRFFSALFGFGIVVLIYFISLKLFKNRTVALLASLTASLEGLLLVMSRIGMNDSYFLFFTLLSILFFLNKKFLFMGLALGLALASKWTAFYAVGILWILYFLRERGIKSLLYSPMFFLMIPLVIYLASYTPFFLGKHIPPGTNFSNTQSFMELQRQMWWYHTRLKATHPYQSTLKDWLFNLRPVWLYVNYEKETISSIYTLGNPLFAWGGLASIIFLTFRFIKKKSLNIGIVLISYFGFFLLWVFSPRIMFNYHYLASSAFLAIALGFTLNELLNKKQRFLVFSFLILLFSLFVYFYPLWTGIYITKDFYESHFWLKSWK